MSDAPPGLLLVTGASGLLGSTLCQVARERGWPVRGLVRFERDAQELARLGVEAALGDVTDPATLLPAVAGADAVVHAAALLGGSYARSEPDAFEHVNAGGTRNVLAAAAAAGVRRTVVVGTIACLQSPSFPVSEASPVPRPPLDETPYARSKRHALEAAIASLAAGQDVVELVPGAIYGPGANAVRALAETSFNRLLVAALTGELTRYARVVFPWSLVADVADVALRAIARGAPGRRYLATGRREDELSVPAFLARACALAEVEARVEEVAPSDDPAFELEFGPIARIARRPLPEPLVDNRATLLELDHRPTPLDDGLGVTIDWLRRLGRI